MSAFLLRHHRRLRLADWIKVSNRLSRIGVIASEATTLNGVFRCHVGLITQILARILHRYHLVLSNNRDRLRHGLTLSSPKNA